MARKVTAIPASISRYTAAPVGSRAKRKVAGYARVSTDHEEQLTSYEAQVDYYTNYIKSREDWEFVAIYTDEGISATSMRHREGFNKMIKDALAGKINLIVTKSVSRFARNTVDSLTTVRKLKDEGIEVYFEKENIWTLDSKGELLITIMSSLAQEESRSISENVTWGHRKRFADGKVSFAYSRFLGYDKAPDGGLVINEEQAETVRLIYRLFLEGYTPHSIARELTERGLLTPGGITRWSPTTVRSILTNEKYKGDALLQKSYTVDFLTKKTKANAGEIPQYYVENNHPAIISPEVFEMVQKEMSGRLEGKGRYSGVDRFSAKIRCGQCGGWYGPKVWHSNDKYRRVVYQCNHKFTNEEKCSTPHLDEKQIERLFVSSVNQLIAEKDEITANLGIVRETLCDNSRLEDEERTLRDDMEVLVGMVQDCVAENAHVALDQEEYQKRYDGLVERYNKAKARLDEVSAAISNNKARSETIRHFIRTLEKQDGVITEFDNALWGSLVDYITVFGKDDIRFTFKDGTEIQAETH